MVAAQLHHGHTEPNTAFRDTPYDDSWIELYHSRPSWRVCQISYQKNRGVVVPFGRFQLIDASDIRPGFRVFRIKATHLQFRLCDETGVKVDSIVGRDYVVDAPGRYVVESGSGCRRVSSAQIPDCLHAIRPKDRYVEISFESDPLWTKAYVIYAVVGDPNPTWRKAQMHLRFQQPGFWFTRIRAPTGVNFAFHNGAGAWDSNSNANYQIRLPGKYVVGEGSLIYCGPADLDLHSG